MKCISKLIGMGLAAATLASSVLAQVATWGDNTLHQRDLPAGFVSAAHVAGGYGFAVACFADGTVKAWGTNAQGKTTVPAGLNHVVQVGAGKQFAAALKDDGTVVTWGGNDFGQQNKPAGLSGVKQISLGDRHAIALKTDGTLVAWGGNTYHQTEVPEALSGVTQVAAGGFFTIALKSDGTVVCFGNNTNLECEPPAGLTDVKQVAAGRYFGMALKTNGNVVCWGNNERGQCSPPGSVVNVTQIAAGDSFALALKSDGKTIMGWGDNAFGQSTVPTDVGFVDQLVGGVGFAMVVTQPHILTGADVYPGIAGSNGMTIDLGRVATADTLVLLSSQDSAWKVKPTAIVHLGSATFRAPVDTALIPADRYIYATAAYPGGRPFVAQFVARRIYVTLNVGKGGIEANGGAATGRFVLSQKVPRDLPVTLSSDHPELFGGTQTLQIDQTLNSGDLHIQTLKDVGSPTVVTFKLAIGPLRKTATTTVYPALDLVEFLSPSNVNEESSWYPSVRLAGPVPADGFAAGGHVTGPSVDIFFSVKGSAGATVATSGSYIVFKPTQDSDYTASVTHNGKTIFQTVHVTKVNLLDLSLSRSEVRGSSKDNVIGTITLDGLISQGTADLRSSDPLYAKVPSRITFSHSDKATFKVTHFKVTSPKLVTITATRNGISKSTTITVNP